MGIEQDLFEWRRYAGWDNSAAKARFAAYVLWRMRDDPSHLEFARECDHAIGDTSQGIYEAFGRESAIALELIVKAVIARKLRERGADPATEGLPAIHDLPELWKMAGLPILKGDDLYRLQLVKSVLQWAGRYPTPRNVKVWEDETKEFTALNDPSQDEAKIKFRKPITISWEDFDRLYQVAHKALYWTLAIYVE
jgi:hypothetical protein